MAGSSTAVNESVSTPFGATHRVPAGGLQAWAAADPNAPGHPPLDTGLEVMVLHTTDSGWAYVRCQNDWLTWVDGRALAPIDTVAPPTAKASRSVLLAAGLVLVVVAAGLLWVGVRPRALNVSSPALARGFSSLMLGVMVACFALSVRGIKRPSRARPGFEIGRALFSVAAAIAVGVATGAGAAPVAIGIALTGGAGLGLVEGATMRVVVGSDRRRYCRQPLLPLVVSFAGLLLAVGAAVASRRPLVGVGQLVAMAGTGLMFGLPLGRTMTNRPSPAGRVDALLLLVVAFGLPAVAACFGGADAGAVAGAGREASPLDGTYKGSFSFTDQSSAGFEFTINEVDLELEGDRLTGTLRSASIERFETDEGTSSTCGFVRSTLTGSELQATHHEDGSLTLAGDVQAEVSVDSNDKSCKRFPSGKYSKPMLPVSFEVTESGLRGEFGEAGLTVEATRAGAPDDGGGGGPGDAGTGGAGQKGGADPTTNGAADPSGANGASTPTTGYVIDPNAPKLSSEQPIPPANATDAAVLVVIALGGAGAISAGQAEAARKALEGGAVPQDVIDTLTRHGNFGKMSTLEGMGIPAPEQIWREAQQILNTFPSTKTVTSRQYVEWMKKLEETLPHATWQQITAAIHHSEFGTDVNRELPTIGGRLFENGPETDGYQSIMPWLTAGAGRNSKNGLVITDTMPKWVIDASGNKVDITHAVAGLRSDLNRPPGYLEQVFNGGGWQIDGPATRNFMRWANTHGGDSWQVIVNAAGSSVDHGQLRLAWEFAPTDQRLGNDVGIWLSDFYRNPANGRVPLSNALSTFFNGHGSGPAGRTSYY
jgi:hypothetical protein